MRQIISAMAVALLASPAVAQDMGPDAAPPPMVSVAQGRLTGSETDGIERFANIPFAAPPVGDLRWRPPSPPVEWQNERDASRFGPACPQPVRPAIVAGGVAEVQSEDCLQLNVWRPTGARDLPVMVWIHGGAHVLGSGTFPVFDGTALARQDIIVVTINYRLGLLGYFAHPALTAEAAPDAPLGNYGLMDQLAALEWVRANIAAFGGDPDRVTLAGESAGAVSTMALLTNPRARSLFSAAILQSGVALNEPASLAAQETAGVTAAARAGLTGGASAEQLRALDVSQVVAMVGERSGGAVNPFIDGRLITEAPWRVVARGDEIDVPLIVGANSNEASVLLAMGIPPAAALEFVGSDVAAARQIYGSTLDETEFARQVLGDVFFVAPARWMAEETADGAPSWLYHFDYVASPRRSVSKGAAHGSEIPYIFGTLAYLASVTGPLGDEDGRFSDRISTCWVSFIKIHRPECEMLPDWPAYSRENDTTAILGVGNRTVRQFRQQQLELLLDVRFGARP